MLFRSIVSITDTAGDITYVNDKFLEISGYGRDDLIGKNHRLLKSNVQPQTLFEDMWRAISAGQLWHGEMCNRGKDGRLYWLNTSIVPFLGENGLPTQYISVRTDITPMKESEAALWKGKQELEQRVSERTTELRDQLNFTKKLMTDRERGEAELKRRYEEVQALNTKLQDMQHQLLQSEKMASVGQLAAGVAHEINNPIGYVYSNLGTLEKYIQDMFSIVAAYEEIEPAITDSALLDQVHAAKDKADLNFLRDDMRAVLSETREGITRVKKIVQDLKDFSRIDTRDEWHWADLQKGLDSTLNIVHNELKYKADVRKEYTDIPEVECRPSQLNQVFLNLLVNAGHAIESKGVITIRTGQIDGQVWVEIADSGKGIEPQHLPRIFDPFFTTKPVGQGTGLGLSLSYGIVQKHGGRIEVQSEPGMGTTFRVWLPITQRVPSEAESHA